MIVSVIFVILAILGLSFLIFIHELGHYWMARHVGMRVETFSIGFGKPLYSWERDGVKWQVGWLLFGGYVKIAGMETDQETSPYDIPDGFFGKSAWDRIKVAFAGPFVNLLFALFLFTFLWIGGGREKNFAEFTPKIGWLDAKSELYAKGVRPGDEIHEYDDYTFQSYKDHFYAPMIATQKVNVKGEKINYLTGEHHLFEMDIKPYPHPLHPDRSIVTAGVLAPANYIVYDKLPSGEDNPLPEGSPLSGSGIQYGDQIVWVDGERIFSSAELSDVLNDDRLLLTVKRGEDILLRRVPRVLARDLRPNMEFREELIDWQYEAGINNRKFQDLYAIPYNLSFDGVVENVLPFIDSQDERVAFPKPLFSSKDGALKPGDKIVAVQGVPIKRSYELLREIQTKRVNIVVNRQSLEKLLSWNEATAAFEHDIDMDALTRMTSQIGSADKISNEGNLVFLGAVTPKIRNEFPMSNDARAWLETERLERKKAVEQIDDLEKRQYLLKQLEADENLFVLGLPNPQDRKVIYNPKPTHLFANVAEEIWRTLSALFSGALSPKYVAGPVGIVHVVQSRAMISIKEALFWLGAISLNLGFLNLLPIPILDGGTILLAFFEMITGRRIQPKTLEKITVVFAILLVSFFLFLTYNDVVRVFGTFIT